MNDFSQFLKERRSIRKFLDKPIEKEVEKELLEAVRWSPSWANTQCWEIIVVRDSEKRKEIQGAFFGKNPAIKAIISAPLLFAFCGKKKMSGYYNNEAPTILGDWFMYDLGIATQSFCLCAHSKGLGTVITGLFDHKKVEKILNLPDDINVVSLVPVGYPDQAPKPPKRKELSSFVYNDFYGNKI
ncbi:MAG: nitroreductase family protein [Desulforegulaceae bacterium]|nr:nitroreductase family protein [Desulforegulaceae bacterium]